MATVILPVGQDLGAHPQLEEGAAEAGAAIGGEPFQVHLGLDVVELSDREYRTWVAAHAEPEQQAALEFNRKKLARTATAEPFSVTEPASAMRTLRDGGLLVEVDLAEGDIVSFLKKYRLVPTGEGFGVSPDSPDRYRIGRGASPYLEVSLDAYYLWSFSFVTGSMWAGCEAYVKDNPGETDITAEDLGREIAVHLPPLIATLCAFLDPIP